MSKIKAGTTSTTAYQVEADTTGTLVLQTGATPTTALTLNADQSVTFAQAANLPNTFGFKNRIINGAMMIDQRNAGASVTITNTSATTYTIDRWWAFGTQASKFSVQRNAGSVTPPVGFINYLGAVSLSAYSVGAAEAFSIGQGVEGFNVADLAFGTANAQTVTVSFWVRSSLTGTFGGNLRNGAGTRSYPFSYAINSANTWEQKTVTVAGDTSGTWLTDNNAGLFVGFSLGAGASASGTAGSWQTGNLLSATGATSVVGTNGATFYITGVQLEKGSTATSFDYRPYGTEFALCQRYFEKSYSATTAVGTNTGSNTGASNVYVQNTSSYNSVVNSFAVEKRSVPTVTLYDPWNGTVGQWRYGIGVVGDATTSSVGALPNTHGMNVQAAGVSMSTSTAFYGHWAASAEL